MAKISIVIPVLNPRPRISETLESIRQQTYPRDEIETIIIDDGSSEQCVRVARTFIQRHGMQAPVGAVQQLQSLLGKPLRSYRAAVRETIQSS